MASSNSVPRLYDTAITRFITKSKPSATSRSPPYSDELQQRPSKRRKSNDHEHTDDASDTGYASSVDVKYDRPILPTTNSAAVDQTKPDDSQFRPTDLEVALGPIKTDQEAIEEYEISRASEMASQESLNSRMKNGSWTRGRSSIYVDAFNLALDTVLEEESHLFDEAELSVFRHWREMDYEAQYLYVRLFLRKTAAWHRIKSLGYHGDVSDVHDAVNTLQIPRKLPSVAAHVVHQPGEFEPPQDTCFSTEFNFADSSQEAITSLEEASTLLRLDELKVLAKEAKVQGKNKKDLVRNLRRSSGRQSGLGWRGLHRSDTNASNCSTTSEINESDNDSAAPLAKVNRDDHFVQKILAETGPCIRLSQTTLKLFERVHLVFYRSTEWTEKSLTTIILARISRRNFPDYVVSRSANIFPSRALLIEFEASIRTQFRIDSILEFNGPVSQGDYDLILQMHDEIYPRWQELVKEEQRKEDSIYTNGEGGYLRRLSPAWVYTRIIHKAAYVLGKLKQHKREHQLLDELICQRLFHASRRGAWYQRKALLEEHYLKDLEPSAGRDGDAQKRHWKLISLSTSEDGLQDPLVHLIHHYDLQKRVTKLEKALKIPKRAQHDFSHVRLSKPVEASVMGVRLSRHTEGSSRKESTNILLRRSSSTDAPRSDTARADRSIPSITNRSGQRTIWEDPLENNSPCSVEGMCLSHYRSQGWKGYHSEGGIVRTLFALLLYDILFEYIPNVFQTAFQACPLDLHSDAFYPSRISIINHRLAAISNGDAPRIIADVWDAHAEKKTCVVGLDWSFERADLLEIATCFRGEALAMVCRVLAQEYSSRGGGVPDLFLWHPDRKEVMFAEVKSENDKLSDTQRMWIHLLAGAGVRVELCNAVATEVKPLPRELAGVKV